MSQSQTSKFGCVGVLFGGDSAEREVSLDSGGAVLLSLQRQGVTTVAIDGMDELCDLLQQRKLDRVINVMHGRGGEDGVVQGLLDAYQVPYTGTGVLGSALAMDKQRSKQVWRALELMTPDSWLYLAGKALPRSLRTKVLNALPVVVKPNSEGSTVGLSIVTTEQQLDAAIEMAGRHDSAILIERYIDGEDLTVAVLHGKALPSIRIIPEHGIYDYEAKYKSDSTRYECPALSDQAEQEIQQLAADACTALAISGWARVDIMRDADGNNWLLEVNTLPGMTSHSLVPMAARQSGLSFDELVGKILETSL